METKGNVDPHLVRIENTLDEHQRRRKGGVDREGLKYVDRELREVLSQTPEEQAVEEDLDERGVS
jgi:hypothetical protein